MAEPTAAEQRYTVDDLLEKARLQKTPVTKRLVYDWVEQGLIDRPTKSGLGRGKGWQATWPALQAQLFLKMLEQHAGQARYMATLANGPVYLWLRYGPEIISYRQVRRALATWARKYKTSSRRAGVATATQVMQQITRPDAKPADKQAFIDAVADGAVRGKLDRDRVLEIASRLYDPNNTGFSRRLGIRPTPEDIVILSEVRFNALKHVGSLTDDQLHTVRWMYEMANRQEDLEQGVLFPTQRIGGVVGRTENEALASACLDAITLVGFLLGRGQQTVSS